MRTAVVATVLVALGVATAACGDDPGDGPPPPAGPESTPAPTATVDPDEAARAVLDAYLRAAVTAKTQSDPSLPGSAELTTRPLRDKLRNSILDDINANRRYEGAIEVVWAEVVERGTTMLAMDVCLDGSTFIPVDIDTGELSGDDPREHPSRHLVRHWFVTTDAGTWVVDNVFLPNWFYGQREDEFEEC